MVVVTELTGSGPREPGARMIVALRAEGGVELIEGTIGGGCLEAEMTWRAREAIEGVIRPLTDG